MAYVPTTKYYSFEDLIVTVAGESLREFAGDEGAIEVNFLTPDRFFDDAGTDGDVVINKNLDMRGSFKFNFLQTAGANGFLSLLSQAQINSSFVTFPVEVNDLNGTSIFTGAKCWIPMFADASYGKQAGQRSWEVRCTKLISLVGSTQEL